MFTATPSAKKNCVSLISLRANRSIVASNGESTPPPERQKQGRRGADGGTRECHASPPPSSASTRIPPGSRPVSSLAPRDPHATPDRAQPVVPGEVEGERVIPLTPRRHQIALPAHDESIGPNPANEDLHRRVRQVEGHGIIADHKTYIPALAATDIGAIRRVEEDEIIPSAVAEICRKAGISPATYFNWKKRYAGLLPTEMKRLKQLEDENSRLKKIVADLTLEREMLQDVIRRRI